MRREVFKLLMTHDMQFYAVVKNKFALLRYVQSRNQMHPGYRYTENEIYDSLASRLFKDRLHKADHHEVIFARRTTKDRNASLNAALEKARANFVKKWGVIPNGTFNVGVAFPREHAGLQAVDYLLWALQRAYERREDRYLSVIWPKVHLVMDIDDTRIKPYGTWYTQTKPITLESLTANPED